MNLIALLLGLLLERALTNLLHLREPRWFDRYFDYGLRHLHGAGPLQELATIVALVVLPVLPVMLVQLAFAGRLLGLPYIVFAILVLIASLGPRDLGEEVEDYCGALARGDREEARRAACELLEGDVPRDSRRRERAIEEAIFVQANNRVFGVIFWFVLLGPTGAWTFRIVDLMRRRSVVEAARARVAGTTGAHTYVGALQTVHGILAWVPARLLALGYALAGSFEHAVSGLREYYKRSAERFFDVSEDVLACVGKGALQLGEQGDSPGNVANARGALRLVYRALVIWLVAIALLTLFGWAT